LELSLAEDTTPYHSKSDGGVLIVIDEKTFLSPLPLATADPSPELAGILANWGLRTLGDLTTLPRDEIVRRFGSEGLALWNRATGGDSRPLHLVTPAQSFTAAMEFEQEIETLEPLLFILRRFLDRLTLELRVSQHVAVEIELTLRLEDETRHARNFRLPEPTADVEILFRTLHTHLESLQTAASISALELRLIPTRPLVRQHGLFDTGLRDPHGFAETLARVGALVNSDRVGTPQREDTHRPDAVKLVPPPPIVPPPAEPPVHAPLGLPLRRFRPPLPATLEFTQHEGKPTYLFTDQFRGEIAHLRGPWRSSGDWWQSDRAWQRTEYDIALADGGLYRLLQIGEAWFIEGEYD
jgi:protein ImuB